MTFLDKPPIVPDGFKLIAGAAIVTVLAGYFINAYAAAVPGILTCFFIFFFRNPPRTIPADESVLVAPADGKVMAVETVFEDTYLNQQCRKIVIFLSVFDAHVNRVPIAGTIKFQQYTCGRFIPAYKNGVGYENERCSIGIENSHTNIMVTQIAGILARRIVSWVTLGDNLAHGQLYGMIKFGSCTEVYVQDNVEITVQKGDHVRCGETIIGRIIT